METQDLVQDVLLSAHGHFDRIENQQQLLHYLIRAARNRSITWWRKRRVRQDFLDRQAGRLEAQGVSPETRAELQLLYKAMDRLPIKQKEALVLFAISGLLVGWC